MQPKSNHKLLFILQAILSSIYLQGFFRETSGRRDIISNLAVECPGEPFSCGTIGYISYPFWGGSRPLSCGRQGFELVCQANIPMLNISSLAYQVKEIDFSRNTLKVARQDLLNHNCPKVLQNTTIDRDLFESSDNSSVTLYFGCSGDETSQLPNHFSCDVDGLTVKTINLYKAGNSSSGPGSGITCDDSILVPVNHEAAQSLKNPTQSSINILQAALAAGFSIQWRPDRKQYLKPFCNRDVYGNCVASGLSGTNNYYNRSSRPTTVAVPTPAPEERQGVPKLVRSPAESPSETRGLSPSQSPDSAPGTPRFSSPNGNGHFPGPALIGIIGGLLLGITFTTILTIKIVRCLKRQRSQSGPEQESNHDVEKFLLQHGSLAPKRYKYSEIKKITKSFTDKLGQGGYGIVYKGMLPDESLVAVKVLIETNSNGEEFINEVASISRTSHVNIVNLLGFCFDRNKRALVYEFMPNKSLDKFISNTADCQLDLENLYKIAVGVAKGLEYLHTGCNTRIVHFDIKPQNILLDEDFCPKISDFGLAKLCKKKQSILSMLGARGTIGYIAPEIFSRNFGGVSHKSDVYSYGMTVLQMTGARRIVETETTQSSENYFPDKIYEQVILDVTRKSNDVMIDEGEETRRKMFLVGFWCIQTTPSDRPSMPKVVEMLEGNLQSIQIPPKPFLFCPELSGPEISPSFSEYVETENSAEC